MDSIDALVFAIACTALGFMLCNPFSLHAFQSACTMILAMIYHIERYRVGKTLARIYLNSRDRPTYVLVPLNKESIPRRLQKYFVTNKESMNLEVPWILASFSGIVSNSYYTAQAHAFAEVLDDEGVNVIKVT
jgi:hypothetical protein